MWVWSEGTCNHNRFWCNSAIKTLPLTKKVIEKSKKVGLTRSLRCLFCQRERLMLCRYLELIGWHVAKFSVCNIRTYCQCNYIRKRYFTFYHLNLNFFIFRFCLAVQCMQALFAIVILSVRLSVTLLSHLEWPKTSLNSFHQRSYVSWRSEFPMGPHSTCRIRMGMKTCDFQPIFRHPLIVQTTFIITMER